MSEPERNPFEESEAIRQAVAALLGWAAGLHRGDTLTYTEFEELTGIERYGRHFKAVQHKFRCRVLAERGIAVLAVENVGFKLATVSEQLNELNQTRQRKAYRQCRRARRENAGPRRGELTLLEKRQQHGQDQLLADELRQLRHGMRKQLDLRSQSIPVRAAAPITEN
jgi:hypothetical protein